MTPLIEAKDLDLRRGRVQVLRGVSLRLDRGEVVSVVGPNGSGKSTLLRCLIGAETPTAGSVARAPGLRVGYVPQRLRIDPTMPLTARRFLSLPAPVSDAEAGAALAAAGAGDLGPRQMADLSGGELQRVLLARAALGRPDALLLDEPSQGLDQPGTAAFHRLLEAIRDAIGCAVLMVSHDLPVVMAASDRVVCLNGRVCCEGPPAVVSAAPAYRELFGAGTWGDLALRPHRRDLHDRAAHHRAGPQPHSRA